jgi:hypothetical protein
MVELVRGVSGGRIWTAITHAVSGAPGPVTIQTFASASDHAPATTERPANGQEARMLASIERAATQLVCAPP